ALQRVVAGGTGLPHQQGRPGPAPDRAPARRPGPSPRADLHARLLPVLAPAQSLGAAPLRRRTPPGRDNPVAPARRSASANAKAARQVTTHSEPARNFRDLLYPLA